MAIYLDILEGELAARACRHFTSAYKKVTLAYKRSVRHVIKREDFSSTAWESAKKFAARLIKEYIYQLRETDFRKEVNSVALINVFILRIYESTGVFDYGKCALILFKSPCLKIKEIWEAKDAVTLMRFTFF